MSVSYFYAVLLARGPLARAGVGRVVAAVWRVLFRDDEGRRARRAYEEHSSALYSFGAQHLIYPLLGRGRCRFDEGRGPCSNTIARRLPCERHFFMCC